MVQGFIGRILNQPGSCGFPPEVTVITDVYKQPFINECRLLMSAG